MKTRKIILASSCLVLLVIAVIQSVAGRVNPVKTVTVKEAVDEIKIDRPEGLLTMKKVGDDWFIGDKNYTGNFNLCEDLVDNFKEVKLLGKVTKSDNEAVLAKYDLNEGKACNVTLYAAGKEVKSYKVGKASSTGSQYYLMMNGSNDVYMASGSVDDDCHKSVNEFRSKAVIQISKDDIQAVTVTPAENAAGYYEKSGVEAEWTMVRDGDSFSMVGETVPADIDLDPEKCSNWIFGCASYAALDWLDDSAVITDEKILDIKIRGKKTISLELFQGADNDGTEVYFGKCSETPYAFKVAKYSVQKYQKNPGDFSK